MSALVALSSAHNPQSFSTFASFRSFAFGDSGQGTMCQRSNTTTNTRRDDRKHDVNPETCSVDDKSSRNDLGWPEEAGSASCLVLFVRRWTYSFMGRILRKGSRQMLSDGTHLCQEDLYRVPSVMRTSYLDAKFRDIYAAEQGKLNKTLWRLAAPTFVPAGFCQLLTVLAQVGIPVVVKELLDVLEENPGQSVVKEGMPYAVLIFVLSVLNAFGNHRQRHLATMSGVVIRAALVSAIYGQSLSLTPEGRSGLTSGEVTNLVAIDTQKLFEVFQEGHLIWSCPLAMILVTVLLLLIMGPSTIVGMVVLFAFVPVIKKIILRMIAIRQLRILVSDERCEIVNAMLQGIKVTKLNNYESRYLKRIEEARGRELKFLRRELWVWALTLVVTVNTPILASAATFATYVLVSEENILTPATTFTVLLLFSALRFPINYGGRLVGKAAQAIEASRRISAFLSRETRKDCDVKTKRDSTVCTRTEKSKEPASDIMVVKNGTFRVGTDSSDSLDQRTKTPDPCRSSNAFSIRNVDFSLSKGEILAVVGPVGSGKTTLMNALVGETASSPEALVTIEGKVAFAGQVPFILNSTLRENILFGLPYERQRYEQVIDACCLRPDLEQLGSAGDLTEIGERGVTLSGGQKQRVSLARVAYSAPDVALFDDPLSALDAGTSKRIFERQFKASNNDLLSSSAIVLVTHASHFLHRVDKIMVLSDGKMQFLGNWGELSSFECDDPATRCAVNAIRSSVQEDTEDINHESNGDEGGEIKLNNPKTDKSKPNTAADTSGMLMTVERREHGLSSYKTWFVWFKHAGGPVFVIIQVLLMTIDRSAYVATEWWLTRWTAGHDESIEVLGKTFSAQTEGRSAQYEYLKVYSLILLVTVVITVLRSLWAVSGGARSARSLFLLMTKRVLHAPMSYFETTPLGRILNRFTYDVEVLDMNLTEAMTILMIASSWFVAGIVVMSVILPWILVALIPVTIIYGTMQLYFRKSGADLQRLDAVSRSPVQAMLAEGLDGASTIRVFRQERNFLEKFQASADTNSSAQLNFISAQRWIGVRIELLGSIIVAVACIVITIFNDVLSLSSGLVGMLIIWSSNFTITLGFLVDNLAEAEAAITSIERIHSMTELPQEKAMTTPEAYRVDSSWPLYGKLEFEGVCLRYRDGLPLALNCLSFQVPAGKRCGVVGRTGAGKSSLTTALFRLVEIEAGRILLDGVDLSKLGLEDVRGRPKGMSIIPQDPVLFAGTLRECLDPFGSSNDQDVLDALLAVRLNGAKSGLGVLEEKVEEGGANFSVGERQLLCLARTILAKPKVLVMDEATASVDGETDAFIQQMLRTRFENTTILTVAHRLNTIMDYDLILVMDDGKAVEFGSPSALLEAESGVFTSLVNSTGDESASFLKSVAHTSIRGN